MSVQVSDIASLRRMVSDPATGGAYSDADLTDIIEDYPLTTGYDLNAAAAQIWAEKAGGYVESEERFSADGSSFDYGSLYEKAMQMRAHYAARVSETYSEHGFAEISREDISDEALYNPFI